MRDISLKYQSVLTEVTEEMKRWGVWIAQTLDADGMRLDALKHIKNAFIADFIVKSSTIPFEYR